MIEHTPGILHKIKLYIVYGKMFLFCLLINFLVEEDYELPKCTSQILSVPLTLEILIHHFFSSLIALLRIFCVRLLPELMKLLSPHHEKNHLTCRNNLRQAVTCNLILKV